MLGDWWTNVFGGFRVCSSQAKGAQITCNSELDSANKSQNDPSILYYHTEGMLVGVWKHSEHEIVFGCYCWYLTWPCPCQTHLPSLTASLKKPPVAAPGRCAAAASLWSLRTSCQPLRSSRHPHTYRLPRPPHQLRPLRVSQLELSTVKHQLIKESSECWEIRSECWRKFNSSEWCYMTWFQYYSIFILGFCETIAVHKHALINKKVNSIVNTSK